MASILTILFFLSHLIWANLNKHHYILINPQKSFYQFNGEFTVAHIGSKRLTHRLIVSWYRLKLAQSSQKSAGSSHCLSLKSTAMRAKSLETRSSKKVYVHFHKAPIYSLFKQGIWSKTVLILSIGSPLSASRATSVGHQSEGKIDGSEVWRLSQSKCCFFLVVKQILLIAYLQCYILRSVWKVNICTRITPSWMHLWDMMKKISTV